MTSKEYVEELDWQSAIAAATLILGPPKTQSQATTVTPAAPANLAESYLYRGIARCFIADKEGKHKEAVEDLSKAIVLGVAVMDEAYYYRAYAFYLDGDYEKAIADCKKINNGNPCSYGDELLGKIYFAMGKYEKAVDKLGTAIIWWYKQNPPIPSSGLLDSYREACKRMNSV